MSSNDERGKLSASSLKGLGYQTAEEGCASIAGGDLDSEDG